jgi:hypothetical protein
VAGSRHWEPVVVAVLVAPAACARLLAAPGPMALVSVAVASPERAGLYLSYYAGIAGGASIALCLVGAACRARGDLASGARDTVETMTANSGSGHRRVRLHRLVGGAAAARRGPRRYDLGGSDHRLRLLLTTLLRGLDRVRATWPT